MKDNVKDKNKEEENIKLENLKKFQRHSKKKERNEKRPTVIRRDEQYKRINTHQLENLLEDCDEDFEDNLDEEIYDSYEEED